MRRVRSGKADEAEYDQRPRRVTHPRHLNREIDDDHATTACFQGVLRPEDLERPRVRYSAARRAMGGFDTTGRFVCENDFSKR